MDNVITLNERKSNVNIRNLFLILCCVLFVAVVMLGTSGVAYCDEDDPGSEAGTAISTSVSAMATQIYKTMRAIITPLVIVAFAFAGFQFLLGGKNGTEKARNTLFGAAFGLAIVIFAPLFGQAIATWFAGSGTGDLTEYNPLD